MQQKYKNNADEKKIKAFFSFRQHICLLPIEIGLVRFGYTDKGTD